MSRNVLVFACWQGVGGRVRMLIVDWNSVEECCLRGDDGQHLGQGQNWGFFIDPDAMDNALRGGSVETSAVIRDCQVCMRRASLPAAVVWKILVHTGLVCWFHGTQSDWTACYISV